MRLLNLLSAYKFSLGSEVVLQKQIADALTKAGIPFEREYRLSARDRVDFFSEGAAIEIKIKGQAKAIYKQCERYAKHDCVESIILITNKSMGLPSEINKKPAYMFRLGRSWL